VFISKKPYQSLGRGVAGYEKSPANEKYLYEKEACKRDVFVWEKL